MRSPDSLKEAEKALEKDFRFVHWAEVQINADLPQMILRARCPHAATGSHDGYRFSVERRTVRFA